MSKDDEAFWDTPAFRPVLGRRGPRPTTFKVAVMQRLQALGGKWGGSSSGCRPAPRDVKSAPKFSRRCVVKARYVQMRGQGIKAARLHLDYIEREGVERDGSKGRLFNASGDVDRQQFGAAVEGEKRQFRFIVSPEDGAELDLRDYTTRLVARMEKDLGQNLRWAAVCHYNTDNPHVHLVVRGVDAKGAEVWIDRVYISEFLRLRAQELATKELGPRPEIEMQQQLTKEVSQERLTGIDRRLAELVSPDGSLDMASLARGRLSKPHAMARLETLGALALAERTSPTSWRFKDSWQETLKHMGERGDIIKRMHQALHGQPHMYRVFDPGAGGGAAEIEGVVRHKGLHDELGGDLYAIVQTPRGEAHYLRVDQATAEQLKEGERVRIKSAPEPWVKGPDHVIARAGAANRGVYSPALHLQQLSGTHVAVDGQRVSPQEAVEVNQRRLERLERFKLVSKLPDGTWRVPHDLVEQLRDRERTHPRHRLQVERLDRDRRVEQDRGRGFGLSR